LLGESEIGETGPMVTALVDAGPKAKRDHRRFEPDGPWQRKRIAELYEASGRRLSYLGDWHSHPRGNGPSRLDRTTARKIARTAAARCPHPVFLIATYVAEGWELRAYRFVRWRFRREALEVLA
jgi:integrative and conjugative element protein (TIGR02256 family)